MQSSDEYSDPHDDPSDDDYDPRPSSSLSTPTRRRNSLAKRASPAKVGKRTPMAPMKRTLSLYSLPAEIIDAILYEPTLRIHDHMTLARTCRTLRAVYYTPPPAGNTYAAFSSPVWAALVAQRPFEGQGRPAMFYSYTHNATAIGGMYPSKEKEKRLKHLWSDRFDETKMVVLGSKRTSEQRKWDRALQMHVLYPAKHERMLIRSEEWTDAIADVAKQRITKTTAKQNYKLSEAELGRLPHIEKRNPHYRGAAPMQLYVEAAVERLAYKLHGGYQGHLQVIKTLTERAAKANQTRRAKAAGTWQPPTPQKTPRKSRKTQEKEPMPTPGWRQLTPPPIVLGDEDDDGYGDEAGSPTPGPSRAATAAAAAPGPIYISDNDNDDSELMFMEPKTPTRRVEKKRTFSDEDGDDDEDAIVVTPPPKQQQRQQQLPTPLSPLGGVSPLSMAGAAGPSTPSPSARKKRRGRRRKQSSSSSSVKQETNPTGGMADAAYEEVKPSSSGTLQVAHASGSAIAAAGPAQTLPKFEGLAWLSPWSEEEAVIAGGGVPVKQDAQGFEGDVKKEEQADEETIMRSDGRPARRGARRDYSIYA
ncbi:hypothetical protein JCM8115_002424 [Rhodotorula mucilaginosa]